MNWATILKLIQITEDPVELIAAAMIVRLGGGEEVRAIVEGNGSAGKRPDKAQRYRERNREKLAAKARERRKAKTEGGK
jgi:hypothetical protein